MAGKSTAISIHITGDASGARKAFKDASSAASGFEGKAAAASAKFRAAGDKMQATGKDLSLKVTLPLVAAGGAAFKMAADVQDAMGASSQIYGSASGDVKRWANSLPSYYGIAKGAAYEYTNIMGSLMKNLGGMTEEEAAKQSTALTGLAGDLAAMYGGSTDQAVNALTSALKGNTEMLDNYGISATAASLKAKALELGISDGTSVLTDQQKQAAMLAIIWEQTGDAQGQAAREANSASGQMRALKVDLQNLATEMGAKLLPVGTKVLSFVGSLVEGVSNLPGPLQTGALGIAGLAAVAGPTIYAFGALSTGYGHLMTGVSAGVGAWKTLTTSIQVVGDTAKLHGVSNMQALRNIMVESRRSGTMLSTTMKGIGAAAGAGGAAVGVFMLADALYKSSKNGERAKDSLNQFTLAMDKGNLAHSVRALGTYGDSLKGIGDMIAQPWTDVQVRVDGGAASLANIDRAIKRLVSDGAHEDARAALEALAKAADLPDNSPQQEKINRLIADYTGQLDRAEQAAESKAEAEEVRASAEDAATESTTGLAGATVDAAASVEELNAQLSQVSEQLERMSGAALEADQAERALKEATDRLMQSLAENGRTFDINTEKGRANRDALDAQVQAAFELAAAQSQIDTTGKSSTDTLNGQVGALMRMQAQGLLTKDEYNRLLQVYGLTPDAITTRINADTTAAKNDAATLTTTLRNLPGVPAPVRSQIEAWIASGSFHAARAEIDRLTARRTISIDAFVRMQNVGDPAKLFGWRAKGGPVSAGKPYMVGEEGPELIVPDANGMVLTAAETAALARGAGSGGQGVGGVGETHVHVHLDAKGSVFAGRDAERWLNDILAAGVRRATIEVPAAR